LLISILSNGAFPVPCTLTSLQKHILSTVLHALAEFSVLYIDKNNIISIISLLKIEINNEIDQFI
jgi:hypothetical protein